MKIKSSRMMIDDLKRSISNNYKYLKKNGYRFKENFLIFEPKEIKEFILETLKLFDIFIGYHYENFLLFSQIFNIFLQKTNDIASIVSPPFSKPINKNYRDTREIRSDIFYSISIENQIKDIVNKQNFSNKLKIEHIDEIVQNTKNFIENLKKISDIEMNNLNEKKDDDLKDPFLKELDVRQLIQNINRIYEYYKYVNGFFLALFDCIASRNLNKIEERYFDPTRDPDEDMYYYPERKKKNKNFYRENLSSLKEYLNDPKFSYPGLFNVFKWVFEEKTNNFIRKKESNNLNNINQDRIKDNVYYIYSEDRYIPISDLNKVQNEFFYLITLISWLGSYFLIKLILEYDYLV